MKYTKLINLTENIGKYVYIIGSACNRLYFCVCLKLCLEVKAVQLHSIKSWIIH